MEIVALLHCLQPYITLCGVKQMKVIAQAMLAMTGRVTMLGISRWAEQGGSYRTVQRFFHNEALPWGLALWIFFRMHLYQVGHTYLLVGDEVVSGKAGKETHGVDWFFSSLAGKPIPGLAFFALSLVGVEERHSFPVKVEQIVRSEEEKAASRAKTSAKKTKKSKKAKAKRQRGRPKGSRNKDKVNVMLTPELLRIKGMVETVLKLTVGFLTLTYFVLDGHFGNNNALQMTLQCGLHLVSKLRFDSALYLPYEGPYAGSGPQRKYGAKLDYRFIPNKYLQSTTVEGNIETRIYQLAARHKEFSQMLNVVIIVKFNLQAQTWAHVILFSSDLTLSCDQLSDYYVLRFQIEFNFRDAKQFWGLEDFMNVSPTAVTNAANLSFFMINLSYRLLLDFHQRFPDAGILDLKAHYRGYRYAAEVIKCLPQNPDPILLAQIFHAVSNLGRIHPAPSSPSPG